MKHQLEWYIPVSYAADLLDCHWRKVFELIDKGFLDFIRMPQDKIRVSKKSVEKYLRMHPSEA